MKTVFFDTNVMIDIIGRRQQFCRPSLQIMSLADRGLIRVYVCAMSYATASFILGRTTGVCRLPVELNTAILDLPEQ